jgi:hypothetical protein
MRAGQPTGKLQKPPRKVSSRSNIHNVARLNTFSPWRWAKQDRRRAARPKVAKNCWNSTKPERDVNDCVSNHNCGGAYLLPHFGPATFHDVDLLAMRCFQATRIVANAVHFSIRTFCGDAHDGRRCEPSANRTPGECRKPSTRSEQSPQFLAIHDHLSVVSSSVYATGESIHHNL